MSELSPCPFCGGEARTASKDYGDTHYWRVFCDTPSCAMCMTGVFHSEAEAIAAWNTRAPMSYEDLKILLDELGVSEQTCEYVIEDNMNESEGMGDVWFRCTNCGTCYDYYADDWLLKMSHCPKCGATVKGVR